MRWLISNPLAFPNLPVHTISRFSLSLSLLPRQLLSARSLVVHLAWTLQNFQTTAEHPTRDIEHH